MRSGETILKIRIFVMLIVGWQFWKGCGRAALVDACPLDGFAFRHSAQGACLRGTENEYSCSLKLHVA
jgi:hypothetical protein